MHVDAMRHVESEPDIRQTTGRDDNTSHEKRDFANTAAFTSKT